MLLINFHSFHHPLFQPSFSFLLLLLLLMAISLRIPRLSLFDCKTKIQIGMSEELNPHTCMYIYVYILSYESIFITLIFIGVKLLFE